MKHQQKENNEDQITFIDNGDDTEVSIGNDEPVSKDVTEPMAEDDRWRRAEEENANLRAQLSSVQNHVYGQQRNNEPDPYDTALQSISEQERALGIEFEAKRAAKALTSAEIESYDAKARALHQKRNELAAQKAVNAVIPSVLQAQQANYYRTTYADVHANQRALQYAKGRYEIMLAEGAPDSPQTVEKAFNDARIQFRLSGAVNMKPTDQDKQQLAGVGGGGGRNSSGKQTVTMNKAQKAMAMSLYGEVVNGDEKKAYAMWAKGPGLRALKESQKRTSR